jgi:hypothetical protein
MNSMLSHDVHLLVLLCCCFTLMAVVAAAAELLSAAASAADDNGASMSAIKAPNLFGEIATASAAAKLVAANLPRDVQVVTLTAAAGVVG